MNETKEEITSEEEKLEVMYYCKKCDHAWWYDETGQLHASKIPPMYKKNVVKNAEYKLCKECDKMTKVKDNTE